MPTIAVAIVGGATQRRSRYKTDAKNKAKRQSTKSYFAFWKNQWYSCQLYVYNILESTASAVHDKCGTTDDDLDALFAAIDKEIELDPG